MPAQNLQNGQASNADAAVGKLPVRSMKQMKRIDSMRKRVHRYGVTHGAEKPGDGGEINLASPPRNSSVRRLRRGASLKTPSRLADDQRAVVQANNVLSVMKASQPRNYSTEILDQQANMKGYFEKIQRFKTASKQ